MFTARWKSGKEHTIPDVFSCAPVGFPDEEDIELSTELDQSFGKKMIRLVAVLDDETEVPSPTEDLMLKNLKVMTESDEAMKVMVKAR